MSRPKTRAYRVAVAVVFGLIGFGVNFLDIEFLKGATFKINILAGLFFPLVVALAWGWRYGLLSALAGGCQTMWWLWSGDGWGVLYSVPVFTLWIVWHGWWAEHRFEGHPWYVACFAVEIPYRIVAELGFLVVFRWLVSLNPPPWNPAVSMDHVSSAWLQTVAVKHVVEAYVLLMAAYVALSLGPVRRLFGLPSRPAQRDTAAIYAGAVLFGLLLWTLDALVEYFVFPREGQTFWGIAVHGASAHEVFMRSLYMAAVMFAGIVLARMNRSRAGLQELLDHRNRILSAIRNVNQLIVQEKDPDRFLDEACRLLVETRGYYNAWIVLMVDGRPMEPFFHAGFNGGFAPMTGRLRAGDLPLCAQAALSSGSMQMKYDPPAQCADCPLSPSYAGRTALALRLEHAGRVFGWMSLSCPAKFARSAEEHDLMKEVADDIAFALWAIETETQRETLARKYAAVLATTSDAVMAGDPEGRITVFNPGAEKMFGCMAEEALGSHIVRFCPEDRVAEQAEMMRRVRDRGAVSGYETERLTADGRRIPVEVTLGLNTDDRGRPLGINAILRDISERKQAENVLRESEEKFSTAFQTSPYAITITRAEDGKFIEVNDAFMTMSGFTREEALADSSIGLKVWMNIEDRDRVVNDLRAGLTVVGHEYQFRRKDDKTFLGLFSARAILLGGEHCILSSIMDITERKRAQEALARQQRSIKLSNRIANVFLTSSRNEVFADVLDVLLKALDSGFGLFGYIDEAGDLVCPSLTRDVWEQCQVTEKRVVFPRAVWGGLWGRSLMEMQTLIANENLQIPEGHVALENALATPIVYNDNLIGQFVVANKAGGYDKDDRDLLESAAAQTAPILFAIQEEARQKTAHEKLEAQLRQAQKMEAVGRLAGGVAHDFNNMLGIIIGHADMLLEEIDPDHPFHADLTEIRKAGARSADLTRQLLAFARKQTVVPKVIDLNKAVEGMLKMLQRLIGEDIDMAWIPGGKVWLVKIDPGQIDQILANLCVNARDAIAGVGKVTIETGNIVFDEDYCADHAGFVPGEYALLGVSDNGCGMDSETQSHLFEPFFTTKELGKGTGLGLATVYGVVRQNNGFINVYSEPGQGTTFRIYLPRHRAKEAPLPDKEVIRPAARGHETILLVEDEPAILRMSTTMLERSGYTVLAAGTPGEAIRLAHEHTGDIHLLMTDVVMPEMNGRDLAKNILSLYPRLKCLFMSGYTANVIAHHGILDEGVNFIQKPFSMGDLAVKVREVLDPD